MIAERPSSAGKSLDVKLVTEEPDLVMAHLKARHASEEQMSSVADIGGKVHFRVLGCAVFAEHHGRLTLSLLSNLPTLQPSTCDAKS